RRRRGARFRSGESAMRPNNTREYIELLVNSQLVTGDRANALFAEFRELRGPRGNLEPRVFGEFLVEQKVITSWQNQKLAVGRWRGFFMEGYCFLEHLSSEEGGRVNLYTAKHTKSGELFIAIIRRRDDGGTDYSLSPVGQPPSAPAGVASLEIPSD
ncbi:MAG: hypothetical protein N2C14_06965, partial [Planctomycetales bacterium]